MRDHELYAARLTPLVAAGVTAALLLPLMVAADSRIQTGGARTALSATAHVNFKIVIPTVLYLNVGSGSDRTADTDTVAIMSNGRHVTLNAALRAHDSTVPARGSVILSAAARGVIAQDARCTPLPTPAATAQANTRDPVLAGTHQVICTASMP